MRMDKFYTHCEIILSEYLNESIQIISVKPLTGGSINNAFLIQTQKTSFFIKTNSANKFPDMFGKEASGLTEIRQSNSIRVPNYIAHGEYDNTSYLILEFIQITSNGDWKQFAHSLALMHKYKSDNAGLSLDNYMGSLSQSNKKNEKWADFFITERLIPQLELASGIIDKQLNRQFQNLFNKLEQLIPDIRQFSLLHGDLWSGNFIFDSTNHAVLIDPAVYYGHHEVDIAMTTLFGGFDHTFYTFYNEAYALESGWKQRLEIYNLYPLLVHVNLFGTSYLNSIETTLNRFN